MNNSELLFLYDAKMTNPNGNVDDENRPRMDYDTQRNLVSDVRLKRYIRDYLKELGKELYVSDVDGKTVNAEQRLEALFARYPEKVDKKSWNADIERWMLEQLIDVRLFGATMAVKGNPLIYTGPVQFSWGYSLNPVRLMDNTITSHFSSKGTQEQGTFGKDYRVVYSFLAFYGQVSGRRAEHTGMSEEDLQLLDEAMIRAIPLLSSRSKIGQAPRLYMRIEYKDNMTMLGDWREQLPALPGGLTQIDEVRLPADRIASRLEKALDRIEIIHFWQDDALQWSLNETTGALDSLLSAAVSEKIRYLQG
jgi:CRISPR-associated protein Cas7/Csh2, subtype I-B/HMARI